MINVEIKKRLLLQEALRWVGSKEEGTNKGQIVTLFQNWDNSPDHVAWCFRGNIEIYTLRGWVRFDNLVDQEPVAQVESDGGISFVTPWSNIKKEYNGIGWHIKNRDLDIVCDKEHRFWGTFNGSKVKRFDTLDNVTSYLGIHSAKSKKEDNPNICDRDLELLAAFLSDGFFHKERNTGTIEISVSRIRKIQKLNQLLPFSLYKSNKVYGQSKSPLTVFKFKIPESFLNIFSDYKILEWDFINSLSQRQALLFAKAYAIFDGSVNGSSYKLFTNNKAQADRLSAILTLAGVIIKNRKQPYSDKLLYVLSFCLDKQSRCIKQKDIKPIQLQETLYCVQVSEGRILCRDPNGTVFVTGNCMAFVQFCLKNADLQCESIAGECTKDKHQLERSEHCLTVWNKSPKECRLEYPEPGSIAIWQHYKDGKPTTSGHTGIVIEVDNDQFVTIEGNTSDSSGINREGDGVYKKVRTLYGTANMRLLGFLRPWL